MSKEKTKVIGATQHKNVLLYLKFLTENWYSSHTNELEVIRVAYRFIFQDMLIVFWHLQLRLNFSSFKTKLKGNKWKAYTAIWFYRLLKHYSSIEGKTRFAKVINITTWNLVFGHITVHLNKFPFCSIPLHLSIDHSRKILK